MENVDPNGDSTLVSGRSPASEQSSLGLLRLDSVAGFSDCFLEDDSSPSARVPLSPVKQMRLNPPMANIKEVSFTEGNSKNTEYGSYESGEDEDPAEEDGRERGAGDDEEEGSAGGLDSRYLRHGLPEREVAPGAESDTSHEDSVDLMPAVLISAPDVIPFAPLSAPGPAPVDISGRQISARSTSIGASSGSLDADGTTSDG
ncbi:uncharacterized protein LOC119094525 [Pollicipes pollicipes]|uniref:uncharacterized protein LOC119094525 n=1 Tax=Pollicipes pollicipes TaxID=41117 RepID=UPI001884F90A|nr:uncharacterized protein LOC119094525 [Pollicipes pollicipes]